MHQTFDQFRARQIEGDGSVPLADKQALRQRLIALEGELNLYLPAAYGVRSPDKDALDGWVKSHELLHWFVEFFGTKKGGVDAVVGNPPYVASSKIGYLSPAQRLVQFPDIFAHVMLQSLSLAAGNGRCGMIVPLSLTFSEDFGELRRSLAIHGSRWFPSSPRRSFLA